ncbi:hypothetical protein [Flavobacterium filum]|uniref:hypothetical protein n=1 Tax=Flavobacterium filum TaxID=370974 RepID=UPI0023EF7767|nr:hypothetical protein [Flavobacterium filum]
MTDSTNEEIVFKKILETFHKKHSCYFNQEQSKIIAKAIVLNGFQNISTVKDLVLKICSLNFHENQFKNNDTNVLENLSRKIQELEIENDFLNQQLEGATKTLETMEEQHKQDVLEIHEKKSTKVKNVPESSIEEVNTVSGKNPESVKNTDSTVSRKDEKKELSINWFQNL